MIILHNYGMTLDSVYYGNCDLHKYLMLMKKYDNFDNSFTVYRPRDRRAWSTKCILQRITAFYRYNLAVEIEPVTNVTIPQRITGLQDTALWYTKRSGAA